MNHLNSITTNLESFKIENGNEFLKKNRLNLNANYFENAKKHFVMEYLKSEERYLVAIPAKLLALFKIIHTKFQHTSSFFKLLSLA